MQVRTTITARDNIDQAQSTQMLRAEIQKLYLNATSRLLSDEAIDGLLDLLIAHANAASERSHRAGDAGQCDVWHFWQGDEDPPDYDYDYDPAGMVRAWSMVIHGVMTSFGYLHD